MISEAGSPKIGNQDKKPLAVTPATGPAPGGIRATSLSDLPRASRHGRVTAVSMMKDEGPYLLEWVAHHLAVGFTDLVVYTNDCSDGTDDMLIRLEELGLAHHRRNVIPPGLRPQPSALNHAQEEPVICESDWVLVFDADEFLCIRHGDGTLDPMLDDAVAQGANGIVITWRIFGSGGVKDWSRDPVSEQYRMAAPMNWNKGWGVKTLFRYDPEYWKLGIHRPKIKNKWIETEFPASVKWLNGSGQTMDEYFKFRGWRSITRTVGYDWAQMNHYAVKSIDSYAIRKFRGNVNLKKDKYNADYWALQDRNEVRDDTMLRYAAARGRIFDLLLGDPELARLHHAALARAEERLATFKATPDYEELVAGLQIAAQVPLSQVVAKPPQARDPVKIAALMSRVEWEVVERQRTDRLAGRQVERRAGRPPETPVLIDPPLDGSEDPKLEWHASQGVLLPADPRFFSPYALETIRTAKFDRPLSRALNRSLSVAKTPGPVLDLGAGCGFRAALLARHKSQPDVTAVEANPARARLIETVWRKNGLKPGPGLQLISGQVAIADLIANVRPRILIVADPDIDPDALIPVVSGDDLDLVIVTGPALHSGGDDYAAACHGAGFETLPASVDFLALQRPPSGAAQSADADLPISQGSDNAE